MVGAEIEYVYEKEIVGFVTGVVAVVAVVVVVDA